MIGAQALGSERLRGRVRAGTRTRLPLLRVLGLAIAGLISLPVLAVARTALEPADGIWVDLVALTLPRYLATTAWLLVGVGAGVLVLGVGTAWLVSMCRFPASRAFEWLLLLPMAMPAYVVAYVYTDLLQFAGPVQSALRAAFGWRRGDYIFPEIRSLEGAIAVLALVLYPYVYLLARAAFLEASASILEAARMLGHGPWRAFAGLALPLARPAIVAGLALALMEAVADFGTVKYFEVDTFTTGIYLAWFNLGSPTGAAKLAALLLAVVVLLLGLERLSRGQRRFDHGAGQYRPITPFRLRGVAALAAQAVCALPVALGFVIPAVALLRLTLGGGDRALGATFLRLAQNSFVLAVAASLLAVLLSCILAYGVRGAPTPLARLATRVATLGYAVPGSVIAVGVLLPFGWFDNVVDAWARTTLGVSTGLLLSGTMAALVFGYLVRFLAVSYSAVESGLSRIPPSMDDAARTLGLGPGRTLLRVHAPIMGSSLLTAVLFVFVEVIKELPATLIVRPFNFDTLAVRVYQLAADERLAEASTAALAIVAVGILPVIALSRAIARARPGQEAR